VIHRDGWPASRRLPEPHRERALKLISERAAAGADRFDQVWWAEWTGFVDATKLYRVASVRTDQFHDVIQRGTVGVGTEGN